MPAVLRTSSSVLVALAAMLLPVPAASATSTGGASADFASGGAKDPARSGALEYGAPSPLRPVARLFRVTPGALVEGATPRVRVRIDHPGARRVAARIVVVEPSTRRVGARIDLGRVRTGRTVKVAWPADSRLAAGTYTVRLHAKDPGGETLARAAHATGKATLVVRPRPRPEKSQPEPPTQPTAPAPSGVRTGVFPVAGPHTYGGDDARFGAGRRGHKHEGQDLVAAAGTPVVAPLAGTIAFVDYQAGGAGHYVVMTAEDGRTFFFAHLQTGSIAVSAGQRVPAAATLGRVGSTGASSGPHLHFEIWEGGWRHQGGRPIDPLAQLRAWDR
jgi:murein DD-endopeptidase MepM/ murein hydrolase activator NlpD